MQASTRIAVNTMSQYIRTIVNVLLSLYSARLVLQILGESDFGLYSLVGGVVALLSFITNSLVTTTQRFLSVEQGKGDSTRVKAVFNNSMIVHVFFGIAVIIVFEALLPMFFGGVLNIPAGRDAAAKAVYHQVVAMVFISFVMAPYRAALVARENIVYISAVDIADGVFKCLFAFMLQYVGSDRLVAYGWTMLAIRSFNFLAFAIFCHIRYEECRRPRLSFFSWGYVREMMSFTGWTMYGSMCVTGRNQGLAIVLNRALGTVVNAAYGIGMQLSGYIYFVSSSFVTAVSPQLMKAEGSSDRDRMLFLAKFQSKMSYLLLATVAIPAMFEARGILELWLGKVPAHTVLFSVMFILANVIDQLTQGLGTAINAKGRIGWYSILSYTPKLCVLPLGWMCLHFSWSLWTIAAAFIAIEAVCMLARIPLVRRKVEFNVGSYLKYVFGGAFIPTAVSVLLSWGMVSLLDDFRWRFLVTFAVSVPVTVIAIYFCSLTRSEREKVKEMIKRVIHK